MREKRFRIFTRLIMASMLALAISSVALAQGGGRGGGGGHPGGGPSGGGPGMGGPGRSDTGFPTGVERGPRDGNSNVPDGGRRRDGGQDNSNRTRDNGNNAERDTHRLEGIAHRLNTTPDQLRSQYQAALASNPNLKFGQFVAANLIANNLNATHSNITTAAILSGLSSGKSLGETLQGLGLSADEAKDAERAARKAGKHKS